LHRPAGKYGFVEVIDGHFCLRGDQSPGDEVGPATKQRFRMWGVNVCFGANFPSHSEADKIAPHLAKLGINAVRIHHADGHDAPNGIWGGFDAQGLRQFSPDMVDRLDYFLAKLHEHGIYANLNMHVSRELGEREGFPKIQNAPWWAAANKYVMYYDPDVQAQLKRFCKDFLSHENPYRKLRRVEDPGIAMIELMNENYFSEQGYSYVQKLPERYRLSLQAKWNQWLKSEYRDDGTLRTAWKKGDVGLGAIVIPAANWKSHLESWIVNRGPAELPRSFGVVGPKEWNKGFAIRFAPKSATTNDYDQQLMRQKLSTKVGRAMTLSFWVRADLPRKLKVELSTVAGGDWKELGLFEEVKVGRQWEKVVRVFTPNATIQEQAYLAFSFGDDKTAIEFAGVELVEGSPASEPPRGQSIPARNFAIPDSSFPPQAHLDMKRFMVATEMEWVRELKAYVRELGVRVPITASQVDYHAAGVVESELDYADMHNYWHHPIFPAGADWSPTQWSVGNQPMEAGPTNSKWPASSLLMRTPMRIAGKPMTLSEWNYPEPSVYSAGCVPMAAMIASLQDWDAVFFFDYEAFMFVEPRDRPFFKHQTNNFFSFNAAPAKLTALTLFSNVYLRGDLSPLPESSVGPYSNPPSALLALQKRIGVHSSATALDETQLPDGNHLSTPNQSIVWDVQKPLERGTITIQTEKTMGVWGTIANQEFVVREQPWRVGGIKRDYGILIASSMDNLPLGDSRQVLLLAGTHTENTGMKWNKDRTSVGDQWGTEPTRAVAINAKVSIPWRSASARVTALDGRGIATRTVPCQIEKGAVTIEIGDQYQTMWYAIETIANK
jgi:hypothetical protein